MHEMSITQGVVDICTQNADNRRVTSVTLEIGTLSGVVPEAIEFCFEACTRDTLLYGARLLIDRVQAVGLCRECKAEFALGACFDPCPVCGAFGVNLVSGEELRVKELEVE